MYIYIYLYGQTKQSNCHKSVSQQNKSRSLALALLHISYPCPQWHTGAVCAPSQHRGSTALPGSSHIPLSSPWPCGSSTNSDLAGQRALCLHVNPQFSTEGARRAITQGTQRSAFFISSENKRFHTLLEAQTQFLHMDSQAHLGFCLEKGFVKHRFLLEVFSSMQLTLVTYAAVKLLLFVLLHFHLVPASVMNL